MSKKDRIIYKVSTYLLAAMMLMSVSFYVFQNEMASAAYVALGFPAFVLYFNGAAKVLAAIALVMPKLAVAKEWAYAGLTYLLILAVLSHVAVGDGEWMGAAVALVLVAVSYIYYKKVQK